MIRPAILLAFISGFLGSPLRAGDPITIDGVFDDWASVPVAYSDVQGDGAQEDFAELKITNDDTFLFFKLTFHNPEFRLRRSNSITLYIDTDRNVETGLAINGIGAELEWCFGCGEGTFHDGEETTTIGRSDLTLFMAPAFSSQTFEIALSLSSAPLTLEDTQIPELLSLALVTSAQEDFLPDDPGQLEYLIDPTPVGGPALIPLSRTGEEHLRIITYNTEFSGPLDPVRQPAFERIIKALDPDILAFQEMGSASQVEPLIADWLQTTSLWSVSVGNGNSVVSKYPILDTAELISGRRISAILVDTQAVLGTRLLLLNTHLLPFNDALSQEDADELIMQLRAWRSGDGPFELPPNTPIVHVGDFNLAGSSQLLKTLRDGDISDESRFGSDFSPDWDATSMTDLNSRQTGLRAGFTTSRGGASKLDYVFYTDSVMEVGNHYVLNTTAMSQTELAVNGLEAEDTDLASDHLPRVVDIAAVHEAQGPSTVLVASFVNGNTGALNSRVYLYNPSDSGGDVTVRVFTLPLIGDIAQELTATPLNLGTLGPKSALNIKLAEDILTPLGITPPYTTDGGNLTLEFTIQAADVRGTAQVFSSDFAFGTYPLQEIPSTLAESPTVLVASFMNGNNVAFNSRIYLWNPSDSAGEVTVQVFSLPLNTGEARELTGQPLSLGTLAAKSALNIRLAEDLLTPLGIPTPYRTDGGNLTLEFTIQAPNVRGAAQVFSSGFAFGTYPLQVVP